MKFNVTVDRDEDGVWIVECPSIPGCVSQGATREEAMSSMNAPFDAAELKQLLKDALIEFLTERREDFQELLAEALEDTALVKAIRVGKTLLLQAERIFSARWAAYRERFVHVEL